MFVHNGTIRGFEAIKRELVLAISPELYGDIKGTTDSEIMFYLALSFGMADDVNAGVARMVGLIEQLGRQNGIDNPVQMSLGISDGRSLYGFRYFLRVELTIKPDGFLTEDVFGGVEVNDRGAVPNQGA